MILLTGASGFIGRRLAERIRAEFGTSDLTCLAADLPSAYEQDSQRLLRQAGISFLETDLRTGKGLEAVPRRPRLVFHLASNTFTFDTDYRCNDLGTRNLYEAIGPLGLESHVLFTSSVAVMDRRSDYSRPLTEATPVIGPPSTPYGRSKLRAEEWLKERAKEDGFALTILRLVTVYGDGPRPTSFFFELKKLVLRQAFLARLNWPGLTGFVHVADVAEVLTRLAGMPPKPGQSETYFVQAESLTFATVSEWLHQALEVPYRAVHLPRTVWRLGALVARNKELLAKVLPNRIYNAVWRGSLLLENVFWCQTDKLTRALPDWKPRLLKDTIRETLVPLTSGLLGNSPVSATGSGTVPDR